MVNKTDKLLRSLSKKDQLHLKYVKDLLMQRKFTELNITKLKGEDHMFRVKTRGFRIFYFFDGTNISILEIRRRNEATYKSI